MSKKAGTGGYRSAISGRYLPGKSVTVVHGAPMTTARIARVRDALALASEKTGEFRPSSRTRVPAKRETAK
jgi:hypothetical protein